MSTTEWTSEKEMSRCLPFNLSKMTKNTERSHTDYVINISYNNKIHNGAKYGERERRKKEIDKKK